MFIMVNFFIFDILLFLSCTRAGTGYNASFIKNAMINLQLPMALLFKENSFSNSQIFLHIVCPISWCLIIIANKLFFGLKVYHT